jgi:hypothetical protein
MAVKKNIKNQNEVVDLTVTNINTQKYDVVAGNDKALKSCEILSPTDMRIIECYSMGYSSEELKNILAIWHHDNKYLQHILNSPAGKKYYLELLAQYQQSAFVQKSQVVRELMLRLHKSKDADAVNIAKALSKMMGWEQVEQPNVSININWGPDPWATNLKD